MWFDVYKKMLPNYVGDLNVSSVPNHLIFKLKSAV